MDPLALLVGVDLATWEHRTCLLDPTGRILKRLTVKHSPDGLLDFVQLLIAEAGDPARVLVALESPHGALVELLLERQCRVFTINPKQLDRFRDRHSLAGAKDDRRDAYVLADSLRSDLHLFRELHPLDPLTVELREASRTEDELKSVLRQATNRLREHLLRSAPALLALSPAADEPWLWDLLAIAPTPHDQRALRKSRVESLLKRHRIRRLSPDDLLRVLRGPQLPLASGTLAGIGRHIALTIPQLQTTNAQLAACQRWRKDLVASFAEPSPDPQQCEHRDVEILDSVPGIGPVTIATVLAEAPQALEQRDYHALRALAGTAPVTKQSGNQRTVRMRRAVNPRLRNAIYHAASSHAQRDPRARLAYQELRRRGHSRAHALRTIGDRLLRTIVAMLSAGALYDPNRRAPRAA